MSKLENLKNDLAKINLLYVEDEVDVRDATSEFLGNIFSNIDCAVNGQDGLRRFQEKKYSVVITDLKMPEMGGREMIRKLRELDKDVVIIVMTALDSDLDDSEIVCDAHLDKPVKFMDFIDTLESLREKIFRS